MSLKRVPLPPHARLAALADKLKGVRRLNKVLGGSRRENSAEHSWHAALTALAFADWSDGEIDLAHAAALLIVHDLVEVLAGDSNPFSKETLKAGKSRERKAARVLFGSRPSRSALGRLWIEFSAGKSPEAKFAIAIDKFMPMLLSVVHPANVNRKIRFTRARYVAEKSVIAKGSARLWELCLAIIEAMDDEGHFLPEEGKARRKRA